MSTGHRDHRGTGLLPASEHNITEAAARVRLWPRCAVHARSQVGGGEGGVDVCHFGGLLPIQGGHQHLLVTGVRQLHLALLQEESVVRGDGDRDEGRGRSRPSLGAVKGMERKGHEGSRGLGTTAERRGCGVQWQDTLLGTSSSLHTHLVPRVVVSRCVYCVFIQGIHAVESEGWGVEEGPGTGGAGTQGDGPMAFRTCLQSSPGHRDGVLVEAQVMGGIDREVQHGVGPGQGWVAGE